MKKNANVLRRLLALAAVLILLTATLAGCFKTDEDGEGETINNLPGTSDPSETTQTTEPEETEPVVTDPVSTSVMGTVTTDNLNVRSNPSTDGTPLFQLAAQTRVEVLEQRTVDNVIWGRIADGWINLNYVLLDDGSNTQTPTEPEDDTQTPTEPEDDKTTTNNDNNTTSGTTTTGTITAEALHIRKGAGASYDSVGKYYKGDKVTILETKSGWGRTDKGWISMKYVETTTTTTNSSTEDEGITTLVTDEKKTVLGYVTVDISSLNVRYGPGTKYAKKDIVKEGERLAYYQELYGWVRIDSGWISLSYCKKEGTTTASTMVTDKSTKVLGYVVVTSESLNVRYGPGTSYDVAADQMELGDRAAYYQKDGNWVRTDKGWISSKYTYVEGTKSTGAGSGTVTGDELNIRTGPGTGYKSVGKLNSGDKVEILYQLKTDNGTWGYTKDGWVSMTYVKMA